MFFLWFIWNDSWWLLCTEMDHKVNCTNYRVGVAGWVGTAFHSLGCKMLKLLIFFNWYLFWKGFKVLLRCLSHTKVHVLVLSTSTIYAKLRISDWKYKLQIGSCQVNIPVISLDEHSNSYSPCNCKMLTTFSCNLLFIQELLFVPIMHWE